MRIKIIMTLFCCWILAACSAEDGSDEVVNATSEASSSQLSYPQTSASESSAPIAQEPASTTWVNCANDGDYCFFEGTSRVRFGKNNNWTELTANSEVYCQAASFNLQEGATASQPICQIPEETVINQNPPAYWHHGASWPDGKVPTSDASVVIPSGKTILLDRPIQAQNITIDGGLTCLDRDLSIDTHWIMVHGRFTCGTQTNPYKKTLTITLYGNKDDDSIMDMHMGMHKGMDIDAGMEMNMNTGMGNKFIGVMGEGVLSLHGKPATTNWTRLNITAIEGDTQIMLSEPPTWQAGDKIVIASSSEDMNDAEVHTIAAVNGTTITLTQPLAHPHFGNIQVYDDGKGRSWEADTRAEVGLLTRNITIRGDASTKTSHYGAHVMSMIGAEAYIDNVAFYEVGQEGILGRYPFHWHLAGNVSGQYIRNSSIYNSYNRCVTVHQTDYARVENNVCYNHIGHGYFLEDGVERFNHIVGNLSVNAVRPAEDKALLESDFRFERAGAGPSNFWISHPTNTVNNNVAAGGEGTGFWYFLNNKKVTSVHGVETRPDRAEYIAFHNNTAHSVPIGYSSCRYGGVAGWESPDIIINNLTVYMITDSGLWPCTITTQTINNAKVLDAGRHGDKAAFTAPHELTINNSVFVSNSALSERNGGIKGRTAYGSYDQGSLLKDSLFVNYNKEHNSGFMGFVGGAVKNTRNRVENITFTPEKFDPYAVQTNVDNHQTVTLFTAMHDDEQGTLTGQPNHTIVPWHNLYADLDDCSRRSSRFDDGHGAAVCDFRFIKARLLKIPGEVAKSYSFFRRNSDETKVTQVFKQLPSFKFIQSFSVANRPYHFGVSFVKQPTESFQIAFAEGWPNDRTEYELENIGSDFTVRDFRKVNTLTELKTATDNVYLKANNHIRLRFNLSDSEKWQANLKVYIDKQNPAP